MAETPSPAQVAAYGSAVLAYPGRAPMTMPAGAGGDLTAPMGIRGKPRLKLMNNGEIRILGVDSAAAFFPPLNPLQPVAQFPEAMGIRPWDYPVGWNQRVTPRTGYSVGFGTLKALADGFDVLRIMIERVKDKIATKPWAFLPKDEHKKPDDRCKELEEFFAFPDREHSWQDWARMLLEQAIVYDAPAVYLRPTRGGELFSAEVWDGSLISPKIMADGRAPPADAGPAYQQVLKGLPAVDWIKPVPKGQPVPADPMGNPFPELLYKPRNPRVDSPYGYGPVEQIVMTINIAIRQEVWLLSYYTDGSQPDVAFSTPSTWTTQDIANFKRWWDSVLSGNLAERRGTMFLPDGTKIFNFKEGAIQDNQTAEWVIRVMCFALGLNPMPFVKQMNRGQEQTHHEEAQQEGEGPWISWLVDFIGAIVRLKFGWDDIEFRFDEADSVDPVDQSKIDASDVAAGIYHPDEIRANRGDSPMPADLRSQMAMVEYRNTPNATLLTDENQANQDDRKVALANQMPKPEPQQVGPDGKPVQPQTKPAEKAEPVVNHFKFDAPQITMPAITIAPPAITVNSPPVNVTLPEMKQADVFVDVGATNVKVDMPKGASVSKTVTAKRRADGSFEGVIREGSERKIVAKVEG
jgi:Phage portal protein